MLILQIQRNPKTFILYDSERQVYDHVIFCLSKAADIKKLYIVYVAFCSLKIHHNSGISACVVMDFTNSEVCNSGINGSCEVVLSILISGCGWIVWGCSQSL